MKKIVWFTLSFKSIIKVGEINFFSPKISMHLYSVYSNPKVIKDMTLKIYVIARPNVP